MEIREWEEKYYGKMEEKDRKKLLEERLATGENSAELELIQKLFDVRYKPEKGEREQIDHMLRAMMQLKFLKHEKGLFQRYPKKQVQAVYKDLGKETAESYGELGRRVWFRELNHLGRTFLSINLGDRGYTSMFWGIGQLKDSAVKVKLAKDICQIAYEAPVSLGITQELEVFTSALFAAYEETFPEDAEILRNVVREKEN